MMPFESVQKIGSEQSQKSSSHLPPAELQLNKRKKLCIGEQNVITRSMGNNLRTDLFKVKKLEDLFLLLTMVTLADAYTFPAQYQVDLGDVIPVSIFWRLLTSLILLGREFSLLPVDKAPAQLAEKQSQYE
ncbi:MAG TPA: hypothetical protein VIF10_07950 [Methylobacter sp.]